MQTDWTPLLTWTTSPFRLSPGGVPEGSGFSATPLRRLSPSPHPEKKTQTPLKTAAEITGNQKQNWSPQILEAQALPAVTVTQSLNKDSEVLPFVGPGFGEEMISIQGLPSKDLRRVGRETQTQAVTVLPGSICGNQGGLHRGGVLSLPLKDKR